MTFSKYDDKSLYMLSPVSEVLGKRLQNFVVLFSEVCDLGKVKVLPKLCNACEDVFC